ncbi:MAG: CidA/LrgA family protein [Flavobacteriaceae bacterium]
MVQAFALLLFCQLAGEAAVRAAGAPLPGPVLGCILLVAALALLPRLRDKLDPVADTILRSLSLFFVPAGVGIAHYGPALAADLLPVATVLVATTALTLAVTAGVYLLVKRAFGRAGGAPE